MISERPGRGRKGDRGSLPSLEDVAKPATAERAERTNLAQPSVPALADWRRGLPVLMGQTVVLREVRASDAQSLFNTLTTEQVSRFLAEPPTTVEGFERFIRWSLRQRVRAACMCFAVTLQGFDTAIGVFQIRQLEPNFSVAEWGFALGAPFWGTGVFEEAGKLVLQFMFDMVGTMRMEARSDVLNARGNGALLKLGAVREGLLRKSLVRNGQRHNQALYSILDEDWRAACGRSKLALHTSIH